MENEIWKDIKGFEGIYQVSSLGRVKSLERLTKGKGKSFVLRKERILKQQTDKYGYNKVILQKDYNLKTIYVHRLVAIAFIPNPKNFPQINHKDEVKTNNTLENLEWCDSMYNNNYGLHNKRISIAMTRRTRKGT